MLSKGGAGNPFLLCDTIHFASGGDIKKSVFVCDDEGVNLAISQTFKKMYRNNPYIP